MTNQALRRAKVQAAKTPEGTSVTRAKVISWSSGDGFVISLAGTPVTSFDALPLSPPPVPGDIVAVIRFKTTLLVLGIMETAADEEVASFPGNSFTSATIGNLASDTLPAGAVPGAVYELECWGNGTQNVSSRQTLLVGVALGGTDMAQFQFGSTAFSPSDTAWRWSAVVRAICHTAGPSGTWTSFIRMTVNDFTSAIAPGNNNMASGTSSENTGTTTVDTTSDTTLALRAKWGATTGSPSITNQVQLPLKRIV